MIIYNITTRVIWEIHDEWLSWLRQQCIPGMLGTGLFTGFQLVRLKEVGEEEGPTYAVQLFAKGEPDLKQYREKHLETLERTEWETWGENAFSFKTVMEVIN